MEYLAVPYRKMGCVFMDTSIVEDDIRQKFSTLLKKLKITKSDSKKEMREKYQYIDHFLRENIPTKLYRYRKLEDHTLKALKNEHISTTKPCAFEKFDSLIEINKKEVMRTVYKDFPRFDDLWAWICSENRVPSSPLKRFPRIVQTVITIGLRIRKKDERFKKDIKASHENIRKIIDDQIQNMLENEIDELRYIRYIASFCEKIDAYKMWEDYAAHNGFALEYNFKQAIPKNYTLFPVMYGEKYNATDLAIHKVVNQLPNLLIRVFNNHPFWHIFFKKRKLLSSFDELFYLKGYAYKKERYRYEQEWRLLSPETVKNSCKYNHVSFNPVAIYFNKKMNLEVFNELNQIAKEKGLRRHIVTVNEHLKTIAIHSIE